MQTFQTTESISIDFYKTNIHNTCPRTFGGCFILGMEKISLLGKNLEELKEIALGLGMPAFTGKQISEWIYKKKAVSIDDMTNLSIKNRELLKSAYQVGRSEFVNMQASIDGTVKYLFKTSGGHFIESVYIPEDDRATLCISSQVGCKMNCHFCMTGKQGFTQQLSVEEILNQFYSIPESDNLTNIVFMGMGEPLDNYDNVKKATDILVADWGQAWSPRRITVSTIGLIPGLKRFLEESECHLAYSLHSPFADERLKIMPVQKPYPFTAVLDEIRKVDFSHQRRMSIEYIMFNGFNDSVRHAMELIKILKGIDCRVNLIRFHAIPGVELKTSNNEQMVLFRDFLTKNGVMSTIRKSRGEDIFAACGMLSTKEKEKSDQNH